MAPRQIDDFVLLVAAMRSEQARYFELSRSKNARGVKAQATEALAKAKKFEKDVDDTIALYLQEKAKWDACNKAVLNDVEQQIWPADEILKREG